MPVPPVAAVGAVADEVGRTGTYRLLLALLAEQRGLPLPAALDHPALDGADTDRLLADLRAAAPEGSSSPTDDLLTLGDVHQRLLGSGRKSAGAWFTPWPLVEHLLEQATAGLGPEAGDLLDPACGGGVFLAAAARRLVAATGPGSDVVDLVARHVHGIDLDPDAAELTRVVLWLELLPWLAPDAPLPAWDVRTGDALGDAGPGPSSYDVVVGNPPFLNQLERATVQERAAAQRLRSEDPGLLGPYTDLSAVFLARAASWVRPGGRVALVQPSSLLAARDAAGVRRRLADTCVLESLWTSEGRAFDAAVNACAPVLLRRARDEPQGPVARTSGVPPTTAEAVAAGDLHGSWGNLVAGGLGVPALVWRTEGMLGEIASCAADFRDQYYGLAGAVTEAEPDGPGPGEAPLVTSGLIDPGRCDWGVRPTRFLKQTWQAPVVALDRLTVPMAAWAAARLVAKVLVGTQGRVVEAVADPDGTWLPSVPVISVVPEQGGLWHVLAVLLAPPISVHAATTYAGTALSPGALKLSARQVAALPLPVERGAWDEAAELLSQGQEQHLRAAGELMCAAYDVPPGPVLDWWQERVLRPPGRPRSGRRAPRPATAR